ncbi:MAG: hypothetical protein NC402_03755 [Prevotella sp.]|nr:hypothetical protein [Prevotella sp.]MCM1074901.1 hypothetical protein [Ruminococcus sp.]
MNTLNQHPELRYTDNFELWCRECVCVTDKITGATVPFILNRPQRRVAAILEDQRRNEQPIRMILLKARQWGGSTLVQIYMAWLQLIRHNGWNSLICGHVKDASANIRGMYSMLLRNYPDALKGEKPKDFSFSPFEGSRNINYIAARDCRVTLASAIAANSVRGGNYQMAHLSEVAFWGDGDPEVAARTVRSIAASVALEPETLVVMESTADGEDNFFHDEWQRAVAGKSDKTPVFVPWHEIEIYRKPFKDEAERKALAAELDDYERSLLSLEGVDIKAVHWYHQKRREYPTHEQMMAEYPSTPEEAFTAAATPPLNPVWFF